MFKCLPFIKGCGAQVESIEKRHASLASVPDDVLRNYRTLEECRLDANQIKELPNAFFRIEKLRILTISDNEIIKIPPAIGNFSCLVELDISRNDINDIPPSIRFCDALQFLDASNNSLRCLPEGFSQLRSLRVLNLNDVSLFELPSDFGSLKKLQKLELRENCLTSLPDSFSQLLNLEFLDLGGNDLSAMPSSIGALHNLVELWLDDNQMTSIAEEIGNLRSLQQLDLSENQLTSLPRKISGLTALSDLNLTQNYLDSIPDEIGELRQLTVLKLNRNQIVDLKPAIGKCESLLELYVTENYLSTLPITIGQLTKMFHFNADKNQLCELPTELGNCTALNILSLCDNNLRRLPSAIGNCVKLRVIDVSGNRLDRLPVSLISCPLTALWLSQSQSQPIISLQRAVDDGTNEDYLTCYLLPQEGNDEDEGAGDTRNSVSVPMSSPGATSNQFNKDFEFINGGLLANSGTSSMVNLASDGEDNGTGEAVGSKTSKIANSHHLVSPEDADAEFPHSPVDHSGSTATRVRFTSLDDKPHSDLAEKPREYPKTRHPVHLKKSPDDTFKDNELRLSDQPVSPVSPLLPSAALNLHPISPDYSSGRSKISSHLPVNGDNISAVKDDIDVNKKDNTNRSASVRLSKGMENTTGSNSHASLQDKDGNAHPSDRKDHVTCGGVSFAPIADEVREDRNQEDNNDEDPAYSSGGEEIDTIAKSVAFSDEVVDNEDNTNQKLIRRDTPHYTKRARIHGKNSDGGNNEEAVLKLLKKYHDASDPYPDGTSPDNVKTANALLMVAAAAAAAAANPLANSSDPSSVAATQLHCQESSGNHAEQITLHITLDRSPGGGLGLSIAGGCGSVPFRGMDQGIFVSRLAPAGLAEISGLNVGDKLLEVNGVSMVNVEHHIAVNALRTESTKFKLLVSREISTLPTGPIAIMDGSFTDTNKLDFRSHQKLTSTLPMSTRDATKLPFSLLSTTSLGRSVHLPSSVILGTASSTMQLVKCTINRDWSGLGFSIAGGRGLLGPHPNASATIYISRIVENGAAAKSGILRIGDQLIKINGIDVRSARHDQVITLLTGAGVKVDLEVLRELPLNPCPTYPSTQGSDVQSSNVTNTVSSHGISEPKRLRYDDGLPVDRVFIKLKECAPLGFVICGGIDVSCAPFGGENPGIFVSQVSAEGEAHLSGLRVGDRILAVGTKDMCNATHDEAVKTVISNHNEIVLDVRRDPQPAGLRELEIACQPGEKMGLQLISFQPSLVSGTISPATLAEDGIFVSNIAEGGSLARDGRLKSGDRLLEANCEWLLGLEPQDVAELVQPSEEGRLLLTVCNGLDSSQFVDKAASVFRSLQPSSRVNPCNLIDCDGSADEMVKPLKPEEEEFETAFKSVFHASTGHGYRRVTYQESVEIVSLPLTSTLSLPLVTLQPSTASPKQDDDDDYDEEVDVSINSNDSIVLTDSNFPADAIEDEPVFWGGTPKLVDPLSSYESVPKCWIFLHPTYADCDEEEEEEDEDIKEEQIPDNQVVIHPNLVDEDEEYEEETVSDSHSFVYVNLSDNEENHSLKDLDSLDGLLPQLKLSNGDDTDNVDSLAVINHGNMEVREEMFGSSMGDLPFELIHNKIRELSFSNTDVHIVNQTAPTASNSMKLLTKNLAGVKNKTIAQVKLRRSLLPAVSDSSSSKSSSLAKELLPFKDKVRLFEGPVPVNSMHLTNGTLV